MKYSTLVMTLAATAIALPNVANAAGESMVSLSGQASNIQENEFELSTGDGSITVEVDNWVWDNRLDEQIQNGERVTVRGEIEEGWFTDRELEADSIYLEEDNQYLYLQDAEDKLTDQNTPSVDSAGFVNGHEDGAYVTSRGTVEDVIGTEFTINSQGQKMKVDVSELSANPLSDDRIEEGDRVSVSGRIDEGFFNTQEIMASNVTLISQVDYRQDQ